MKMKLNSLRIVRERKTRAWSQQHLAEVSSLSLRTVQRIENTGNASPESTKAIAGIFDLSPGDLILKPKNMPKFGIWKFRTVAASSMFALSSIFYLSFLSLYPSNSVAKTIHFEFSGGVRVDDNDTHAFDLFIPAKMVQTITIDPDYKLILITPDKNSDYAETTVRLLKRNGHQYEILHKYDSIGANNITRTFSYRVCNNKVTFQSPAPAQIPKCGG